MHRFLPISILFMAGGLAACTDNDVAGNDRGAEAAEPKPPAELASAEEAVSRASLSKVYPGTLAVEEIGRVLDNRSDCRFQFTGAGEPVFAYSSGEPALGVVKLNGRLVELQATEASGAAGAFSSGPVRVQLRSLPDSGPRRNAEMIYEIGQEVRLGFQGFLRCSSA